MRSLLGSLLIIILLAGQSFADTHAAASCSSAHVTTAIAAATAGDTVTIPAGACTWASTISFSGINVIGAGDDVSGTIITADAQVFNISTNATYATRLSDIRIVKGTYTGGFVTVNPGRDGLAEQPFRIDHVYFGNGWTGTAYTNTGALTVNCAIGVADHLELNDVGGEVMYITCADASTWDNDPGPAEFGTANAFYVEDSVWTHTHTDGTANHAIMTTLGGRSVIRYNTISGDMNIDNHGYCIASSPPHGASSTRGVEYYNNTFNISFPKTNIFHYRGGPGYIFNNTINETTTLNFFIIYNEYQLNYDATTPTILCGGMGCPETYPAPQQIGWDLNEGGDRYTYTDFSLRPVYLWNNDFATGSPGGWWQTKDTGYCPTTTTSTNVQSGREFYDEYNSLVATGLDAAKPGVCTDNYGYWATDTEKLYKCASNVWSLLYQPYTYPHPLTGTTAVVAGTIRADSMTESTLISGGATIDVTIVEDTLEADIDAYRQEFIDGCVSGLTTAHGWNAEIVADEVVTAITRVSSTLLRWTLSANAAYDISQNDGNITCYIPHEMLVAATADVVPTPSFFISNEETVSLLPQTGGVYVTPSMVGHHSVSGAAILGP